MNNKIYSKIFKSRYRKPEHYNTVFVNEEDDITDEIEKSLLEIKDLLDLPTDEIDVAIESRKNCKIKYSKK